MEAGMKARMNLMFERKAAERSSRNIECVEDQYFGHLPGSNNVLHNDHSFGGIFRVTEENWLSPKVASRRGLVDLRVASAPGSVNELIEELSSVLAAGADAEHPEIVIRKSGKGRIDRRKIRGKMVVKTDAINQAAAGGIDDEAHGSAWGDVREKIWQRLILAIHRRVQLKEIDDQKIGALEGIDHVEDLLQ